MIEEERTGPDVDEQWLAEQAADLAERIARGEMPDVALVRSGNSGESEALERLLPTIRMLSELADEEPTAEHPVYGAIPANVLGDFQLGREIGRGGIGVVYEARQLSLGRRVAVKVLPPSSRLDPRQLRRFENEARAAAALQHPNIVPVFAYGHECETPYLAMRLIDGRNLAEVIRDLRERTGRGFPPREAAELARQAAEGLDYAHRNDVLHRDIKPSNFLVDREHRLWIADFGLARVKGDSDLTASGDVLGTLRYLSPEQAKGRRGAVDGRSDVYALGATLYELLTLRPVFEGDDRAEILIRIVSEEPRFSRKLDSGIPQDLKTIVLKSLAKEPAERYAMAGELAADLTLFLADQPIRARPPTVASRAMRWARRHGKAVAAVGFCAALLMASVVVASLWSNARLRAINGRLKEEIQRADRLAREAREQARLSERHSLGAQLRLAAHALDTGQPERAEEILSGIPIHGDREASRPFAWRHLERRVRRELVLLPRFVDMALSPDGKILATTDHSRGLELWDVVSGGRIRAVDSRAGRYGKPVFSPDGSLLVAPELSDDLVAPEGFTMWEVVSGRRLARMPMGRGFKYLFVGFLPGRTLLGWGGRAEPVDSDLTRLWRLTDHATHPHLVREWNVQPNIGPAWTGREILTRARDDPSAISLVDPVTTEPVRTFRVDGAGEQITAWACSVGADIVATVSEPSWRLTLWDGRTGNRLATHAAPHHVNQLCVSPDRARLAAIDRFAGVHLIECQGGEIHRVISGRGYDEYVARTAFSPDGSRFSTALAWYSGVHDSNPVSIWETATGRRMATLPGRTDGVHDLIFTPDGGSVLIASRSGVRLWRLTTGDADRDRQPAGHKDEAWSVAFSPDGRSLATGSDDTEPDPTIKLWDPMTSRLTRSWQGGSGTVASLAFSPDGRVLVSGHLVATKNVRIWDAVTGRQLGALEGHTDRVRAVAFAGDGRLLASASSDGTIRLWDAESWRERAVLRGHADTVHAIAYSPDGRTLASAGNDGDVRLWDLPSLDCSIPRNARARSRKGEPPGEPGRDPTRAEPRTGEITQNQAARVLHNRANLMALAFAPDGKTLAVADTLGSITVWDLDRFVPSRMIHSDGEELRQLAFAPDGTALAAAGIKGLIQLWDPATGQELLSLPAHRDQVNGLAFSPDGSILSSVAHDGTVRLWHAEP